MKKEKQVKKLVTESLATVARKNKKPKPTVKIEATKPLKIKEEADFIPNHHWYLDSHKVETWGFVHGAFTPEECDKIIEIGTTSNNCTPLARALTGGLTSDNLKDDNIKNNLKQTRRSYTSWIHSNAPENFWIFQKLTNLIKGVNDNLFQFDLQEIQSLQFTCYDGSEKGAYVKHIDQMLDSAGYPRKLSISVQLSDEKDYKGGDLLLHESDKPTKTFRNRGTAMFFPSYVLHEVTPVTKGIRYSLVIWVTGPKFK
jgi:PKHD-type hydroxylase